MHNLSVCLGRLESRDCARLSSDRRAAIDAFWETYFADGGRRLESEVDGLAVLEDTHSSRLVKPSAGRRTGNGTR